MNEWFVFSLILLGIWIIVFIAKPILRKEMFWVSIFTMPLGLTEIIFVPEYWNPPSLFNLAARTGFDIESLIFCFAIGGIGAVFYNIIFSTKLKKLSKQEMHKKRHRFHKIALVSPIITFLPLWFFTSLNPIYSASIAMFIGGMASIFCRPDLKVKVFVGGLLFLVFYFVFFMSFNLIYPGSVYEIWNLSALSGILILGVPLEELMFALTFGMMWSSVYEHALWYK